MRREIKHAGVFKKYGFLIYHYYVENYEGEIVCRTLLYKVDLLRETEECSTFQCDSLK